MTPVFLPFSSFWNGKVYNFYPIPAPPLYFRNNLFSSFIGGKEFCAMLCHTQSLTHTDLDNLGDDVLDLSWCRNSWNFWGYWHGAECSLHVWIDMNLWGNLRELYVLDLLYFWVFLLIGIKIFCQELPHWITFIKWKIGNFIVIIKALGLWTYEANKFYQIKSIILLIILLHNTRQRIKMWEMKILCISTHYMS